MASLKVKLLLGFSVVGLILIIVGAVIGWKVLTDYVDDEIAESTKLAEGTEQYDRWVDLPFDKTFKVHYFNIDNPAQIVKDGVKPIVTEIGPFVYKEAVHKDGIEYNKDTGILTYDDYSEYTFDAEATSEETQAIRLMTILNVPMMGMIQTFEGLKNTEGLAPLSDFLLQLLMDGYNQIFPGSQDYGLFHKVKPADYSFDGYNFCKPETLFRPSAKIICVLMRLINKESLPTQPDRSIKFSFFGRKDGSSDGRWETNSGNIDINKLGELQSWNGEKYTKFWKGDHCNEVRGGDSIVYAPYNDKDTEFDVYSADICRSVRLQYSADIEHKEIPGYKNILRKDTIDMSGDNECFCLGQVLNLEGNSECLPKGFMDMSTCQDAPIVLSFPHFLWADEATASTVEGLNPNEDDHVTFVEMQPDTGSPLRGSKRVQFNMILRKITHITLTDNVLPAMIPVVWVDEGSEISDDLAKKLQEDYLDKLVLVDGVRWGMIAIGIALFLGCGGFYFFTRNSKTIDSPR